MSNSILIVDDERGIRETLRGVLEDEGFEVETVAAGLEEAWRRGCRLDAWSEHFVAERWWSTFEDLGIDVPFYSQRERPIDEVLPWDHIHVKKGREYLAKEQNRSLVQLGAMASAV